MLLFTSLMNFICYLIYNILPPDSNQNCDVFYYVNVEDEIGKHFTTMGIGEVGMR